MIPDQIAGEYELIKRASDFVSLIEPEIILHVHCGWFPELPPAAVAFETVVAWQMLQADEKWVINLNPKAHNPKLLGVFSTDFRAGDIYTAQVEAAADRYFFPLASPLGELYMMNLLGTGLGMLFHASGVIYQEKGYLFTGHGGAGKTTMARLWDGLPGVKVVNDDKVILRKEAGGFRLYGTPWHGEGGMALPDSAPVNRIFVLKQANRNSVAPLRPGKAASRLLARAFVPLWDREKIAFTLKLLDELCQAIPCQELGFLPDPSAVDFVRNLP